MWYSFWRSRDRFSLDQLRYLTDQLAKVQIVNEVNKDFVIEALRSIAELMTYGDQHDPSYFEFFMEKQVMDGFVRILKLSTTVSVPLQLLQTVSILVQNLRNEHAIYYMFSNEYINYLITYSFDFQNEELLSHYICFLRAISGKLNKNTVSLLVKIQNDKLVSFPLYVEAIRFAFHEESMVRTAVRAVTLNVYHVGDDSVNRYITSAPHKDYFSNLVSFFRKQSNDLYRLVSHSLINMDPDSTPTIIAAVDDIEDNLYYFSDVVSAGIPDVGRLITNSILMDLIFPLLLPSLRAVIHNDMQSAVVTSVYLLCSILRIVKIKDLANTIAAALFYPLETITKCSEGKINRHKADHGFSCEYQVPNNDDLTKSHTRHSMVNVPHSSSSSGFHPEGVLMESECRSSDLSLREVLLAYVTKGDDIQVLGSLSMLATLLQTKELDESMLDRLGILPQRKQHKKLLLQALVGEGSGEEELFSPKSSMRRNGIGSDLFDVYHQKIKEHSGVSFQSSDMGISPRVNRFQVIDALVSLFCRSNISAETLWDGGWLLRQLFPYSESEFNSHHLELLKVSYKNCALGLVEEVKGIWPDFLITVLCDEWRRCKRAMESSSPRKEPYCMLLRPHKLSLKVDIPKEGVESEQFWDLLGGKSEYPSQKIVKDAENDPHLFSCHFSEGNLKVTEIHNFSQDDLMTEDIFVLDCHTEIFVWVGQQVNPKSRTQALTIGEKFLEHDFLLESLSRVTPIYVVMEANELPFFTRFFNWESAKSAMLGNSFQRKLAILKNGGTPPVVKPKRRASISYGGRSTGVPEKSQRSRSMSVSPDRVRVRGRSPAFNALAANFESTNARNLSTPPPMIRKLYPKSMTQDTAKLAPRSSAIARLTSTFEQPSARDMLIPRSLRGL